MGNLSEESWVLFRSNSQLVEEGMMPDSFHTLPVVDDTVLDGVLKVQDTSLGIGLISDVSNIVQYTGHLGFSDDSGETTSGSIVSLSPAIPALHCRDPLSITTAA